MGSRHSPTPASYRARRASHRRREAIPRSPPRRRTGRTPAVRLWRRKRPAAARHGRARRGDADAGQRAERPRGRLVAAAARGRGDRRRGPAGARSDGRVRAHRSRARRVTQPGHYHHRRRRYRHSAGSPGHAARHPGGRSAGARRSGPADRHRHLQSQRPSRERQRHHRRERHGSERTGRHRARESAGGPGCRRVREPDSGRRCGLDRGRWWQREQPHDHHRCRRPDLGDPHAGHHCRDAARAGERGRARGLAGDVRAYRHRRCAVGAVDRIGRRPDRPRQHRAAPSARRCAQGRRRQSGTGGGGLVGYRLGRGQRDPGHLLDRRRRTGRGGLDLGQHAGSQQQHRQRRGLGNRCGGVQRDRHRGCARSAVDRDPAFGERRERSGAGTAAGDPAARRRRQPGHAKRRGGAGRDRDRRRFAWGRYQHAHRRQRPGRLRRSLDHRRGRAGVRSASRRPTSLP